MSFYKFHVARDGGPVHAHGDEFPPGPIPQGFPYFRTDLKLWYHYDAGAWVVSSPRMAVEEVDGSPSISAVDTLQFENEVGFNVTDLGGFDAKVSLELKFVKAGVWTTPTAGDDVVVWRAPFACTLTNVRGFREGGTSADINAGKSGVATEHLAADLTLGSADTWIDGGAVQNASYAVGDYLVLRLISVTGNPDRVIVQVDFTRP